MSEAYEQKKQRFEKIMRDNGPMIYTLAIRLTGNPVEGQDLAQQTFLKAFEGLDRFREESGIGTWLYRICVNEWKNRVRYEKRRFFRFHIPFFSTNHDSEEDSPKREIAATDAPLSASLEGLDRQEAVRVALGQLSPQERAIIVMRDIDDKSYDEMSDILNVPLGTVKSRLARAREELRVRLEPVVKKGL